MTTTASSTAFSTQTLDKVNGTSSTTQKTSEELQNNFMTLLVTQLKNQDPLKPLENSELTSQLAQINTLNGIESLNTTLQSITGQIDAGQMLQAASLVGRSVLVPGDHVLVGNSQATPFGFELNSAADAVTVSIVNGAGNVVRQFDLGAMQAGTESFSWDATLNDGSQAPDGAYRIKIDAKTEDGKSVDVTTLSYGEVGSVAASSNGPLLDFGATLGRVQLSNVRQIL